MHAYGRYTLMYLSVGLMIMLAACSNATSSNSSEISPHTTIISQEATPTASSTRTSTTKTQVTPTPIVTQGSVIATPTAVPVRATQPPVVSPVVTLPTPTATQASDDPDPTGNLVLTLACSGPNAQDGVRISNSSAKVCVYTSAGANLTITAIFCNRKPDPNAALQGTFKAPSSGFYQWNWIPQQTCRPISRWQINVAAQWNGQNASVSQASSVIG